MAVKNEPIRLDLLLENVVVRSDGLDACLSNVSLNWVAFLGSYPSRCFHILEARQMSTSARAKIKSI